MIHTIVSIYDTKAKAYLKPVYVQSSGAAVRSFGDAVNNPETEFAKHPEDYIMFCIGTFDDLTAEYDILKTPTELAKALSLKA